VHQVTEKVVRVESERTSIQPIVPVATASINDAQGFYFLPIILSHSKTISLFLKFVSV